MSSGEDIRLVLSDVDGTLVTNDKVLTPAAIAAAKALNDAGIALALTSSRPPYGMRMLVAPLGLTLPMAGCNGAVLANPDLSVIQTHPIKTTAARRTVDFLAARGLDVWLYTETQWFVPDRRGAHVEREVFILQLEPVVCRVFDDTQLTHAVKIVGVSNDPGRVADAEAAAQGILGAVVSAARSSDHFLDVTNPLANKGQMVTTLALRLGILPSQIATIGDMQTDTLMFARSGFSIAMGNASDTVKSKAKAVTDSNDQDGFAKAIWTFILPSVESVRT